MLRKTKDPKLLRNGRLNNLLEAVFGMAWTELSGVTVMREGHCFYSIQQQLNLQMVSYLVHIQCSMSKWDEDIGVILYLPRVKNDKNDCSNRLDGTLVKNAIQRM